MQVVSPVRFQPKKDANDAEGAAKEKYKEGKEALQDAADDVREGADDAEGKVKSGVGKVESVFKGAADAISGVGNKKGSPSHTVATAYGAAAIACSVAVRSSPQSFPLIHIFTVAQSSVK